MRHGTLLALLIGLGVGTLAFSQAPTRATGDSRVDELVKQLGSTKYAERERAQKELEAIGEPALEPLRKASREGDLETSRRAAEMVRRLEDKITTGSLLAPKKVNLKLQDVSVLDAVAELSKQSGYALQVDGDRTILANRKITIDTGNVSFWEALDKLTASAGLVEKAVQPTYPGVRPVPRPLPPIKLKPLPAPAPLQPGAPGAVPQVAPQKVEARAVQVQAVQEAQVEVQVQVQAQPAQPEEKPAQAQPVKPAQVKAVPIQVQVQPGAAAALVPIRPGVPGNPRQITLTDGKPAELPTSYSGAVRIRLVPAANANMQKQAGETLLVLEVAPEPRLQGFQVIGAPSINKAIDDQGQNLALAMDAPQGINPNQPVQVQNVLIAAPWNPNLNNRPIPVRLKLGDKQAKSLKEFSGTLTAQVQLPPEPLLVLDDVLKGQGKTAKGKSGGSLTLTSIEKTGNNEYKLQLSVENMPGQSNPFGGFGAIQVIGNVQIQMQVGGVTTAANGQGIPELVDANGKAYQVTQVPNRSMQINNGEVRQNLTVVYRANSGQGEPARLVVTGTRTTSIAVPFAFKDVPLP